MNRPSSPDAACVCGRLRRAARALTQLYDDAMAPSGLRLTQFSLMRTIARREPVRITELADLALLDRTALSRNLEPLAAEGYVRITPGKDARTREVALTSAGRAAHERALPYWREAQRAVARKLGTQRTGALVNLLADVEALHPGSNPPLHEG